MLKDGEEAGPWTSLFTVTAAISNPGFLKRRTIIEKINKAANIITIPARRHTGHLLLFFVRIFFGRVKAAPPDSMSDLR